MEVLIYMKAEQIQKLLLATDLLKIIVTMAEQGEDYSLIQRNYNDLIESYNLPLLTIRRVSNIEYKLMDKKS